MNEARRKSVKWNHILYFKSKSLKIFKKIILIFRKFIENYLKFLENSLKFVDYIKFF